MEPPASSPGEVWSAKHRVCLPPRSRRTDLRLGPARAALLFPACQRQSQIKGRRATGEWSRTRRATRQSALPGEPAIVIGASLPTYLPGGRSSDVRCALLACEIVSRRCWTITYRIASPSLDRGRTNLKLRFSLRGQKTLRSRRGPCQEVGWKRARAVEPGAKRALNAVVGSPRARAGHKRSRCWGLLP